MRYQPKKTTIEVKVSEVAWDFEEMNPDLKPEKMEKLAEEFIFLGRKGFEGRELLASLSFEVTLCADEDAATKRKMKRIIPTQGSYNAPGYQRATFSRQPYWTYGYYMRKEAVKEVIQGLQALFPNAVWTGVPFEQEAGTFDKEARSLGLEVQGELAVKLARLAATDKVLYAAMFTDSEKEELTYILEEADRLEAKVSGNKGALASLFEGINR